MSAITNATRAMRGDAERLAASVAMVMEDAGNPQILTGTTRSVELGNHATRSLELSALDGSLVQRTYRLVNEQSSSYSDELAKWVDSVKANMRSAKVDVRSPRPFPHSDGLLCRRLDAGSPISWIPSEIKRASFNMGGVPLTLVRADPTAIVHQEVNLSRIAGDIGAAVSRGRALSDALADSGTSGNLVQRTAANLLGDAFDAVATDQAAIGSMLVADAGVGIMRVGVNQPKVKMEWSGAHRQSNHGSTYLARIVESGPVTDLRTFSVATKRPIGASIDDLASQSRALDRIASLGVVRSAEDGAMLVVDKLRALKGIGQQVDEAAGITTLDELGVSLRGVDDSVRGARDVMRGITGQMVVADADELVPTPNVYVGAVGSVLAHLTGARDAYRAAALVLDAAASDPTHVARLRSAAEVVDGVANRFGDRHAPAAISVATASLDDTLEQLPRFWRGKAPELSALLPEEELSRTMFTSRIKPEASFARQRVIDSKLADALDLPLERLDGHQITEPGVDPQQATSTLFEDLAAQLRRR